MFISNALRWMQDNTAFVAALWTLVTMVCSILAKRAVPVPFLHGALTMLAGLGPGDIMKVVDGLARMFGRGPTPPAPPGGGPYRDTAPLPEDDAPPVSRRVALERAVRRLVIVSALAVSAAPFLVGVGGCSAVRDFFGPQNASDVAKAAVCVLEHVTEPPVQIVKDCKDAGFDVTLDVVNALLAAQRVAEVDRLAAWTRAEAAKKVCP